MPELSQLGGYQSLFVHRLFLESCRGANSPELFLPPWANLTGHRLEPGGAGTLRGKCWWLFVVLHAVLLEPFWLQVWGSPCVIR